MGYRRHGEPHDSDHSTTTWVRRLAWGVLIALVVAFIVLVVRALSHFASTLLHTYAEAGKP